MSQDTATTLATGRHTRTSTNAELLGGLPYDGSEAAAIKAAAQQARLLFEGEKDTMTT